MISEVAETVLRRDRIVVLSGLAAITALSWVYVLSLTSDMRNMEMGAEMAMPRMQAWGVADFALTFSMWAVMMVAMMTPSAAPMILMFAGVNRRRREQQVSYVPMSVFLAGYLVVWAAFSVLATVAQWGLHAVSLLSHMMVITSPVLGGVLLVVAGIYQWTPLKHACLSHCRCVVDVGEQKEALCDAPDLGYDLRELRLPAARHGCLRRPSRPTLLER